MNADTLDGLTDPELTQVIATAQRLLHSRAERRKSDAMEQIRQIAATARITVSFDASRRAKGSKPMLRAGDRYTNPDDNTQSHVVGTGRAPRWFAALRDKGKLPAPAGPETFKPKEG